MAYHSSVPRTSKPTRTSKQGQTQNQTPKPDETSDSQGFSGFHPDGFAFFNELHHDNSKAFWEANKPRYEEHVKGPLQALAAEIEGAFGDSHLYRPHRDLRFSKDKRPYKERAAISFGGRGPASVGGQYLQIGAEGLFVGVGSYMMSDGHLASYRRAVHDERYGKQLADIVAAIEAAGYEMRGDSLKRAPKGFDPEHPRVELLKRKGIFASAHYEPAAWMYEPTALERVVKVFADAEPLSVWLRARLL